MKKIYPVILFLFLSAYICAAQPGPQRLEDLKIAYITRELNLNPAEAQNFWPVYNNFIAEIRQARQTYLNDEIAFGEARLNIQKKYKIEFKRILGSDDRVNRTFLAEPQYREMLRKELINRQNSQQMNRRYYNQPPIMKQPPPVIRQGRRFGHR